MHANTHRDSANSQHPPTVIHRNPPPHLDRQQAHNIYSTPPPFHLRPHASNLPCPKRDGNHSNLPVVLPAKTQLLAVGVQLRATKDLETAPLPASHRLLPPPPLATSLPAIQVNTQGLSVPDHPPGINSQSKCLRLRSRPFHWLQPQIWQILCQPQIQRRLTPGGKDTRCPSVQQAMRKPPTGPDGQTGTTKCVGQPS